jgi:hypothetical protein
LAFGSQVYPGQSAYFKDAYQKATSKPYGYLLVDMNPATQDRYRLRTHIFPNDDTLVFSPKYVISNDLSSVYLKNHESAGNTKRFFYPSVIFCQPEAEKSFVEYKDRKSTTGIV